jgi:riboflavin synthase alpha subunit
VRKPGDKVNIENDMQGKYIEKFMQEALAGPLQELRNEIVALRQQMQK